VALEALPDGRTRVMPPLSDEDVRGLQAGDVVAVSGIVVAARDAAHKRMVAMLAAGEALPFDPNGALIYYVGPTPERPGKVIGSAGPTTASRMDAYTPRLLQAGVKGMMGKGGVGPYIQTQLVEHTAVYFAALGGGGALAALRITGQRLLAFEELGPEALREMVMEDFPAWVAHDCRGRDLYSESAGRWRKGDLLPDELRMPERDAARAQAEGALGGGL
jgi:fumarate hydratase subunit beta